MREYDSIADWYQTDRSQTFGVAETLGVAAWLPAHSRILDVGCGNGVPITEALVHAGHRVVGLDSSAGMLARFKINLPGTPIVRGDARCCPFANSCFDAAISWGMIFHLPLAGQAAGFASVSRALKPGAPFLFTGTEIIKIHDDPGVSTYYLTRKAPGGDRLIAKSSSVTAMWRSINTCRLLVRNRSFRVPDQSLEAGVRVFSLGRFNEGVRAGRRGGKQLLFLLPPP